MINTTIWQQLHEDLPKKSVTLVAVSKRKPASDIQELYDMGQRDFGENYVQELVDKQLVLPKDIKWHFIGHLQSNKVKYIVPFVHMIQTIDSYKLLNEVNKAAAKCERIIDVLLQIHIATEDTKFGLDRAELLELLENYMHEKSKLSNIVICGLMGMSTNTEDTTIVVQEFKTLRALHDEMKQRYFAGEATFNVCSMGMSGDYELAILHGSTLVRVGSLIFGARH
jgi:pyridoxal phosphate enzyme (YggS family)